MVVLVIGVSVWSVVEVAKLHLDHTPRWPPEITPNEPVKLHHVRGRYPGFRPEHPACLLIDYLLPGVSGFELQRHVLANAPHAVIFMISGHGDIPLATKSVSHGAVGFIQKPYDKDDLLDKIQQGLALAAVQFERHRSAQAAIDILSELSAREREVFDLLAAGHQNKAIAARLGVSVKTIEVHRAHVFEKIGTHSLTGILELAKAADMAILPPNPKIQ
jgi:two-component system, LuxR family, response regulator FixJ